MPGSLDIEDAFKNFSRGRPALMLAFLRLVAMMQPHMSLLLYK